MWLYDIETRGRVNVVQNGLRRHAADPDLRLLVVAARCGDQRIHWKVGDEWDAMEPFLQHVESGGLVCAHNEAYDRTVWNALRGLYDLPRITLDQSVCSAAWFRSFNLPGALDALTRTLLPADERKGKAPKHMWDAAQAYTEADMAAQVEYCVRDVDALHALLQRVPAPTRDFLDQYHACARMNDLGVRVDLDLAQAAVELRPRIERQLVKDLPEGVKPRGPSFLRWLRTRLPDELLETRKLKRDGLTYVTETKLSAGADVRARLLESDLDDETRRALLAFDDANRTSKFAAVLKNAHQGRIHDQFVFAGAAQTGRASARGIQLHNTVRDAADMDTLNAIKARLASVSNADIARAIRPALLGDPWLIWSDWSAIEARVLPWLAGGDLDRFKTDIYIQQARAILGRDNITKEERQVYGKVPVLALGFGGGVNAFQALARNYRVSIPDAEAERVKNAWRRDNAWAPRFWAELERTAKLAVIRGGTYDVQRITVTTGGGALMLWLPSGRPLVYPDARVLPDETLIFRHPTYGVTSTYGGRLAENVTQAEAASLLRDALVRCHDQGLQPVLQVHDEIVCTTDNLDDRHKLQSVMEYVPPWAEGLPLAAETEYGRRYKIPHAT